MDDRCRCGDPDCSWLLAWDVAAEDLARAIREDRGREAFGYVEPSAI